MTGGTRGLGLAMAKGLAQAGAELVVTGRKPDACDAAAAEIADETGRRVLPAACHMGDWDRSTRWWTGSGSTSGASTCW